MHSDGQISPENLMSLEAYAKWRKVHQPEMVALRRLRSVPLGEHLRVQFENEATVRYQIQEMLRIEKIFEEDGILQEIAAYAPLVPMGHQWKATLLLGYPDAQERQRELAKKKKQDEKLAKKQAARDSGQAESPPPADSDPSGGGH